MGFGHKRRRALLAVCQIISLAAAGALCVSLLAGCGRGGQDLADVAVELAIEPQPVRMGVATVTVGLADAAGQAIEGAQVELEGNMNHAGMEPVFAAAPEVAPGQYEAQLEFTMGGDWFIVVRAALADGRSLERTIDVPGVESVGP